MKPWSHNIESNITRLLLAVAYSLLGALTISCTSSRPALKDLEPQLPKQWTSAQFNSNIDQQWLARFESPTLNQLVQEALGNNPELTGSAARVKAAAAQMGIVAANRRPQVNLGFDASRTKRSGSGGFSLASPITNQFQLGVDISWEADLFNRLGLEKSAASFTAKATLADYQALQQSLAANVARAWFDVIETANQARLTSDTYANYEANLATVTEGVASGLFPALDLHLLRAQAANAANQQAITALRHQDAQRRLELLLGRYPAAKLVAQAKLPDLPAIPATGQPIELLERRPDLLAARLRASATIHSEQAANKNWLPALRFNASTGTAVNRLSDLFDPDFLIWSIASSIAQPIFQGGRLSAEREQAQANREEAAANYMALTLQALSEVESSLNAEIALNLQRMALITAENESIIAESLARENYSAGLVDISTLLESQRRAFDARSAALSIQNQLLQNRVALHLALGGSFFSKTGTDSIKSPSNLSAR